MIILKIIYLSLFLSIDTLLYLRLVKKNKKAGYLILTDMLVWTLIFIPHLPNFHLANLMSFENFTILSEMLIQLCILYFIGRFVISKMERATLPDIVKEAALGWLKLVFNKIIFIFFLIVHVIYIIIIPLG